MAENALEEMAVFMGDSACHDRIAAAIAVNLDVVSAGLLPRRDQLCNAFAWIHEGLVLADRLWGVGAIPKQIFFMDLEFVADEPGLGYFGYAPAFDLVAIGLRALAYCAYVDGPDKLIRHYHPELDGLITARANLVLIVLEECFHRFQIKELGRPLPDPAARYTKRDDPLEIEWRKVRDELIAKKIVEIRPASQ